MNAAGMSSGPATGLTSPCASSCGSRSAACSALETPTCSPCSPARDSRSTRDAAPTRTGSSASLPLLAETATSLSRDPKMPGGDSSASTARTVRTHRTAPPPRTPGDVKSIIVIDEIQHRSAPGASCMASTRHPLATTFQTPHRELLTTGTARETPTMTERLTSVPVTPLNPEPWEPATIAVPRPRH